MGSQVKTKKLMFSVSCWTGGSCATAGRLDIDAHTGAGRECVDAIEAGVGADGPARILHTGTRSGSVTCTPTRLSANVINHAFACPAKAESLFTFAVGMKS